MDKRAMLFDKDNFLLTLSYVDIPLQGIEILLNDVSNLKPFIIRPPIKGFIIEPKVQFEFVGSEKRVATLPIAPMDLRLLIQSQDLNQEIGSGARRGKEEVSWS
jgi:hypothetical protein